MELEKELAKYLRSHALFYVTLDPERALGLEDVLPNYTIICPYKSELTERLKHKDIHYSHDRGNSIEVVVLEEYLKSDEVEKIVQRGTYGILQSKFVRAYISRICGRSDLPRKPHVLVLKNSQLIEDFCKKQSWNLLAPKAKVAEQFEDKISQYKLLKNIVPYPHSVIRSLENCFFGTSSSLLVLQFNRGHSGNSTFFIKSKSDLRELTKKFPKREAKISEHIRGKTYTLNCLVLKSGEVITGSLSEQITGLKSATNNPNTTCGNDFTSPRKLTSTQVRKIKIIAQKVGAALYKKGYAGLFGIDVIIKKTSGKVYFIEVNTHQPASVSFEAKLHRKIGYVPLIAYFILDALDKKLKSAKKISVLSEPPIILPFRAKQIIYRNKTSRVLNRKDLERMRKSKGLVSRMKYIKPNEEILRKQLAK